MRRFACLLFAGWLGLAPTGAAVPKLSYNPSHGEMLRFLVEANRETRFVTTVAAAGRSVRGRQIPVVICQDPTVDPLNMTRLLIMARQHGNEPAGTIALLELIRDLAAGQAGPLEMQLQRVCLLLVPMVNPDGADANTRRNANNIDLNRDWNSRTQPESQAMEYLHNLWTPHAVLDLHELWFNDAHGINTIEAPGGGARVPAEVAAECRRLQQYILTRLQQAGFPVRPSFWDGGNDGSLAHRHFSRDHGRMALLFESERQGFRTPLPRRAQMHRIGVQTVIDYYYSGGFGPRDSEAALVPSPGGGEALPPPSLDGSPTPPGGANAAAAPARPLGPEPEPTPTRPQIRFITPEVTQEVHGTVMLELALSGIDDLETLSVFVDGQGRYFSNRPPFRFAWDTSDLSPGRHVVLVRARRRSGETVEREQLFSVARGRPDTVTESDEEE